MQTQEGGGGVQRRIGQGLAAAAVVARGSEEGQGGINVAFGRVRGAGVGVAV